VVETKQFQTSEATLPPAKQAAWLSLVSIGGAIYFFVAVGLLHFLRPEYDPVKRVASNYAVGPYGFLMTIAFFAFGLSLFALALSLYRGVDRTYRSRLGLVLLGVAGVGLVLSGIFPTDVTPDDSPITAVGGIHIVSGVVAFTCVIVAAFLWSRRFEANPKWQSFSRTSRRLATLGLVSFIGFVIVKASQLPLGGLGERILIFLMLVWMLLTAMRLRAVAKGDQSG